MENSPQQSATNAAAAAANAAAQSGGYLPQPPYHHLLQQHHHHLQMFWTYQRQEIEGVTDFKNHQLPLARIKKIMKADEDVHMISAVAPVLFAKSKGTCILDGFRSSKAAVALKDEVATGLDNIVEFSMVRLVVLIAWLIFSTFNKGMVPTARRGHNSENAVYLTLKEATQG